MPTLTDNGHHELAYLLATQTTYPSWGYMVKNGATTMWERWDTDKRDAGMNSRNHFAFGVVGRWFFETLAGVNIDPANPGFKNIIIRPRPAGDLLWAKADYPSMYGTVRSEWHRHADSLSLKVTIPANTTATVYVPTLNKKKFSITESSQTILENNQPAAQVTGIKFDRLEPGSAVFNVQAGQYEFVMKAK